MMQALENIGVLEKDEERGGRRITQSGQRDLDRESFFCFMMGPLSFGSLLTWFTCYRDRSDNT